MSRFGRTLAKPSRDGHRLRRSGKSFPSGRGLSAFLLRCSSCPAWGGTRANRQKSANPAERTSVRQTLRCAMDVTSSRVQSLLRFRFPLGCWALLRAEFLRTAHGGPSASLPSPYTGEVRALRVPAPPETFSIPLANTRSQEKAVSVPPEKHDLGLRAAASRLISAPTTRGFTQRRQQDVPQ